MASDTERAIDLYFGADAVEGMQSGMLGEFDADEETFGRVVELVQEGYGRGITTTVSYQQPAAAGGFSLMTVKVQPHCILFRHSHDCDCLYYVASGSIVMGNRTLVPGDGFFVPEGAKYGYAAGPEGAEVVEFRHGPERVKTIIAPASPERWDTILESIRQNIAGWPEFEPAPAG